MSDLIDFLRARLADDERATRLDSTARNGVESTAGADVLAYVDRAPREVEAKRLLVDRAAQYGRWAVNEGTPAFQALASAGEMMLKLLALPYSDHPDYREEWRP